MKKTLYLLLAALGLAGATATYEIIKLEPKLENKQEKTLEQITFEQAKLNPSLRQRYLDQILANKDKIGDGLWDSFERLVYDPTFEKHKEFCESHNFKEYSIVENGLAATPNILKLNGKKQPSFFCEKSFLENKIKNEDELFSCIDHESTHAYLFEKCRVPDYMVKKGYSYARTGKESYEIQELFIEAMAYDVQIYYIIKEKRKVTDSFKQEMMQHYYKIYQKIQEISKLNNEDSNFAKVILRSLRCIPKK